MQSVSFRCWQAGYGLMRTHALPPHAMTTDASAALISCPNCAQPLAPPGARYCAHCGQEAHLRPPTLMEFAQQFAGNYISTEGALWRSLHLLFTRPGQLTLEYWAGRRKHYVLPLRLYLTLSVLVLMGIKLAGSTHVDAALEARFTKMLVAGEQISVVGMGPLGEIVMEKGQYSCNHLPQWVCEPVRQRMQGDPAIAMHWLLGVLDRASDHFSGALFVLVPLFAVWTKLLYWSRRRYYTEHLVLALHLHAFLLPALALTGLPWAPAKLLALAAFLIYPLVALHRVFGGPAWKTLLRGAAIGLLHGVAVLLVMYVLMLWALVT
jgi:hypothetical protein